MEDHKVTRFIGCVHESGEFDTWSVVEPTGRVGYCCAECADRFEAEGREVNYVMGEAEEATMNKIYGNQGLGDE